jgi:tRNA/tmRNA/rRNA uracil-C5-methylase (TrmA/RlmC/RlmD family)
VTRVETVVEAIGAGGDGIAHLPDGRRLFLPATLPGETVRCTPVPRGAAAQCWSAQPPQKPK